MSEENKAILRRVTDEVFTRGNLDVVDELFAPDYVLHDPGVPGGELRGIESFKSLEEGDKMAYEVTQGRKGPLAVNVSKV